MSILQALNNVYFWAYSITAVVLLSAAWGGLFYLKRQGRAVEEYQRLFWSWVVFVVLITAGILAGQEVFAGVVALAALFACKEFARATGLYEDWIFTGVVYLTILAVNVVALLAGALADHPGVTSNRGYDVFMATPIYAVAMLCLLPIFRNQTENMLQRVALSVMAFVYFGYFLAHVTLLAGAQPPGVYGYLFFMLYGTATSQFVGWMTGRWIGKHPVAPRINPDSMWEGAAAALLWAGLWSFSLGQTLPSFPWPAMLLATLVFGIMGPLGDLVMRYILADLGLRPTVEGVEVVPYLALGHLNRLIFVAPLFFRLVHWFDPNVLEPPAAP